MQASLSMMLKPRLKLQGDAGPLALGTPLRNAVEAHERRVFDYMATNRSFGRGDP